MSVRLFYLMLFSSLFILLTVIQLIRRGKLLEEYSLIWLIVSMLMFFSAVFSTEIVKWYHLYKGELGGGPSIFLYFTLMFIIFFLMYISVKLSLIKKKIASISQAVALKDEKSNE